MTVENLHQVAGFGRRVVFGVVGLVLLGLCPLAAQEAVNVPRLPVVDPTEVGVNATHLGQIDRLVAEALADKRMPGCVVLIGHQGHVVFHKAYGQRALLPTPETMTTDTIFDLASLTKPIATATSIMQLVEDGHIRLRDRLAQHWPEFAQNGKDEVTVQQLLTHQGGFIADNALRDYLPGREQAIQSIFALKPQSPPGSQFVYSDVGFIVLGELVAKVTGKSLHEYTHERIFRPLGMRETSYLPAAELAPRIAPTQQRDEHWLRGEVHDPRAAALGGVAGHAGLFATADDLAIYAQMLLNRGNYAGVRILGPRTVDVMTQSYPVGRSGMRGLGWDKQSGYSTNRGELSTDRAFGHGGFTGTSLWIDPGLDLFVIILSNRVHPDGAGGINPLAGRIGTVAAAALQTVSDPAGTPVPGRIAVPTTTEELPVP